MPTRNHHSILDLEAFAGDKSDIQRMLIRPICGQKARPTGPDSVTFTKIKSWPSRVALHGGQESVMVEEQCGISRPFRDAVKQTLD